MQERINVFMYQASVHCVDDVYNIEYITWQKYQICRPQIWIISKMATAKTMNL